MGIKNQTTRLDFRLDKKLIKGMLSTQQQQNG
jgi:hypothetical protein